MKTIQEMIEVMQAYENGKQIQIRVASPDCPEWVDAVAVDAPKWNWVDCDYRIKPETKEPTYRPYESTEEMLEDYYQTKCNGNRPTKGRLPMIWVKVKRTGYKILINGYGCGFVTADSNDWDMKELFNTYTYLDGSPCGKLVK